MGPVLLSLDAELQENPIPDRGRLRISAVTRVIPSVADSGALAEAARMLVSAESPVLICDRMARTADGMRHMVELAETLQCAVVDAGGRMNFPSRHPLNQSGRRANVISEADVILAIEMNDLFALTHSLSDRIERSTRPIYKSDTRIITLGSRDLLIKSNFQDFGRFIAVDMAIAGDGESSLPALTEQVRKLLDAHRKSALAARGKQLADALRSLTEQIRSAATIGWDASPITTARVRGALWPDPARRLVDGRNRHQPSVAAAALGFQ